MYVLRCAAGADIDPFKLLLSARNISLRTERRDEEVRAEVGGRKEGERGRNGHLMNSFLLMTGLPESEGHLRRGWPDPLLAT